MDCLAIVEKADDGRYSAYLPDLPGCVAYGDTAEEAKTQIEQAVQLHIESLRFHGEPVPVPTASICTVHAA